MIIEVARFSSYIDLFLFPNTVQLEDLKFIYSEKATKFWEISTLLLTVCTVVKSKVEISQNFVAFSVYMNFTNLWSEELWKSKSEAVSFISITLKAALAC